MQHGLADQHFSNYDEVKKWIDEWIAAKESAISGDGVHKLPERWGNVVASDGQYFEHGRFSIQYQCKMVYLSLCVQEDKSQNLRE
ncbi:hypothetical protein LAZ67_9001573 [Cordylochernes scorpioides]|uniref:Uncharacterized protein n=1 Tax=Cordylochernes scorpioides TaxID=51811 RepID=A0ABY6KUS8_9ARAC|nr:hypothetical protein LAZ67_9001573 [Cordylochernes scorpioides]